MYKSSLDCHFSVVAPAANMIYEVSRLYISRHPYIYLFILCIVRRARKLLLALFLYEYNLRLVALLYLLAIWIYNNCNHNNQLKIDATSEPYVCARDRQWYDMCTYVDIHDVKLCKNANWINIVAAQQYTDACTDIRELDQVLTDMFAAALLLRARTIRATSRIFILARLQHLHSCLQ